LSKQTLEPERPEHWNLLAPHGPTEGVGDGTLTGTQSEEKEMSSKAISPVYEVPTTPSKTTWNNDKDILSR